MANRIKVSFILKYDEQSEENGVSAEHNEPTSEFMPEGQPYELIADPILPELDSDSLLLMISACIKTLSKKHGLERAIDIASKAAEGNIGKCPLNTKEQSDGESVDTWIEENEMYEEECGELFGENIDDQESDAVVEYIRELETKLDELKMKLKELNEEECEFDDDDIDDEFEIEGEEWKNSN